MPRPTAGLDPDYAAALLRRAARLQAEAAALVADLGVLALLGRLGHAGHVGSSASGLMVWFGADGLAGRRRRRPLPRPDAGPGLGRAAAAPGRPAAAAPGVPGRDRAP